MTSKLMHSEITEKVIGSAMKVHTCLGNGFQEVIYQRCLAIEMEKQGLGFVRELEMPIHREGVEVSTRRVDFLVEDTVLIELKAITEIADVHYAQTINYLKAYRLGIGLLVNSGQKKLQWKRFIKTMLS